MPSSLVYMFAAAVAFTTLTLSLRAEELALRPLEPIVAEFLKSEGKDLSELAYICSRGTALFMSYSLYIEANSAGAKDDAIAKKLSEKATPFLSVALILSQLPKKSKEASLQQIQLLTETYAKMMVASKQLNNEIMSPALKKDLDALELIEPAVLVVAAHVEKLPFVPPPK